MFSTLVTCTFLLTLVLVGVQADLTIFTPELVQCKDVLVTWTSTAPSYNLIVVPEDNPCDAIVKDLGDHDGTSMTWKVDIPKYSNVMFSLVDALGEEAWSGTMTVKDSDDASCLSSADSKPPPSEPTSSEPPSYTDTTSQDKYGTSDPPTPDPVVPVGAVNAGLTSGTPSARPFSGVTLAMTVLAAIAAFTL